MKGSHCLLFAAINQWVSAEIKFFKLRDILSLRSILKLFGGNVKVILLSRKRNKLDIRITVLFIHGEN